MLTELIKRYLDAERIWEAQFDEDEDKAGDSAEWHDYMAVACQVVDFRCSSMEEISERAAFMLSQDFLIDIIGNSANAGGAKSFLASMIGPVDKSNNGEN